MLYIGITGHRFLENTDEVCENLRLSFAYFKELDPNLTAVTSLAEGADTLFAFAAVNAGVPLKIILPFDLNEYKKDFSDEGLRKLGKILKHSKHVYATAVSTAISTDAQRNEAYLAAGKAVVDASQIVIAVWDEQESRGKGGTSDIVAYVKSKTDKTVHIIKGVREGTPKANDPPSLLRKYDRRAVWYKRALFESTWILGLVAAEFAVVFFAAGLTFETLWNDHDRFMLAKLEVGCILASIVLLKWVANHWKDCFLKYRRNAEYLRMLHCYDEVEIPVEVNPGINDKDSKITILNDVLDIEKALSIKKLQPMHPADMKRILWILAKDQFDYQEKRIKRKNRQITFTKNFFRLIKFGFLVTITLKFVQEADHHYHWGYHGLFGDSKFTFNFLIILLPSLLAVIETAKYFADWEETIKTSNGVRQKLEVEMKAIISANTENELSAIGNRLRKILDTENKEWMTELEKKELEITVV